MVIYMTVNMLDNKFYIGKDEKNKNHYYGSGLYLNRAIKKYGKENFKKFILQICSNRNELNERERFWIKLTKAQELGYNIADGGQGGYTGPASTKQIETRILNGLKSKGRKLNLSDEQKYKIGSSNRGKKLSKAHKEKLRITNTGRKLSEEHKEKIRKANTGHKFSEETKEKLREAWKHRKPASAETLIKIGKANKGKKHTNEAKEKMRKAALGRKHTEETKEKLRSLAKKRNEQKR